AFVAIHFPFNNMLATLSLISIKPILVGNPEDENTNNFNDVDNHLSPFSIKEIDDIINSLPLGKLEVGRLFHLHVNSLIAIGYFDISTRGLLTCLASQKQHYSYKCEW
ncbi:hypothetical protein ACJX0J_039554, partial [Zea mays]